MSSDLQVKNGASRPVFAVSLTDTDSTSPEALIEILEEGNKQRPIVKADTLEEAIASEAEIIILQVKRNQEISDEILERLKNHKVIGIGYGAAQLFGHLGLEINEGACAHDPDSPPRISLTKNTLMRNSGSPESLIAFELSSDAKPGDPNFAMYIPRKSHLCSVVEVIARWTRDERYGPIVRQGNFIMIGLDTPPLTWTPQYREVFKDLSETLYARELEPFTRAEWPITPPGTYHIDLAPGGSTEELSYQEYYFRFTEPTTFTAHLEHHTSKNIMFIFTGENREHWTRKDTYDCTLDKCVFEDEPLEISISITEEDIRSVGEGYWTLQVTNFDSEHTADCRLDIQY